MKGSQPDRLFHGPDFGRSQTCPQRFKAPIIAGSLGGFANELDTGATAGLGRAGGVLGCAANLDQVE